MGNKVGYISVILPLKLGWEPYYALPEGVEAAIGDRVRVLFAGRLYLGVVSEIGVRPSARAVPKIREIREIVKEKERIALSEIAFWRELSTYYMCSVGEVFKAAYTAAKDKEVKARGKEKTVAEAAESQAALSEIHLDNADNELLSSLEAKMSPGSKLLLSSERQELLLEALCRKKDNANILWLVPEKKFEKAMLERLEAIFGDRLVVWDSDLTPARKRKAAERVRSGRPYVVFGTRSALFLPHRDLGLVIVQDEHESSYKQSSPAPRYNGRDAALILASIFKSACVLTSLTPSLETVYNCTTGKYVALGNGSPKKPAFVVVDTAAELRKNGMTGDISRKLVEAANGSFAVYKPRRAAFPKMEELESQLCGAFGKDVFITDDLVEKPVPQDIEMLAVFGVDAMLGRQDFRADERVCQIISNAVNLCPDTLKTVVIQTREAGHSVFPAIQNSSLAPLMDERREFSLPPYTRLMDVAVVDSIPERGRTMCERLAALIGQYAPVLQGSGVIRVTLARDRKLPSVKQAIKTAVETVEREEKYPGHIYFDVDPVI